LFTKLGLKRKKKTSLKVQHKALLMFRTIKRLVKQGISAIYGTTTESISKAIDRFISMTNEEKNEMKDKVLQVCREHDWSIQADKLFKVYNENIKLSENV